MATRDAFLQPFSSYSPWNTSIGSKAIYGADNHPMTLDLLGCTGGGIKDKEFAHPIWLAAKDSPVRAIFDKENSRTFNVPIPPEAKPDPQTDGHMYVVSYDRSTVMETYRTVIDPATGNITANRAFQIDLNGYGMGLSEPGLKGLYGCRAMNASGMGGILRAWEVEALKIEHALTFTFNWNRLYHVAGTPQGQGGVWPSDRDDWWGIRDYHGTVAIGQMFAIPASVDITKLGLSPAGLALARCLQDYGTYADDSTTATKIHLSSENAAAGLPNMAAMKADFGNVLWKLLRPVLNNSAMTPGGGGVPRRPLAAPLAVPVAENCDAVRDELAVAQASLDEANRDLTLANAEIERLRTAAAEAVRVLS